jgi:CheY-like chemotaxis protein
MDAAAQRFGMMAGPGLAPGVLVVEDEPAILRHVADGLSACGFRVRAAGSIAEARDLLAAAPEIAVVVSDVRMPGGDGLGFASALARPGDERLAREVVVMTGHAGPDDDAAARAADIQDLLRKPFRLHDLVSAVERAMARCLARRAAAP